MQLPCSVSLGTQQISCQLPAGPEGPKGSWPAVVGMGSVWSLEEVSWWCSGFLPLVSEPVLLRVWGLWAEMAGCRWLAAG